jgi:hypothetical protein
MTQHLRVPLHERTCCMQQAWTHAVPTHCIRACEVIEGENCCKKYDMKQPFFFFSLSPFLYRLPMVAPNPHGHALMSSPHHGTWPIPNKLLAFVVVSSMPQPPPSTWHPTII